MTIPGTTVLTPDGGGPHGMIVLPSSSLSAFESGLVSVLVPCCGQLEFTRLCVPSLLRHCTAPYELIFLDVGSLDGTYDYLAGVAAAAPVRVETVRTSTDQGLPAACHEALRQARGEFLVLLNNDTIVTNDWLNQLTGLASIRGRTAVAQGGRGTGFIQFIQRNRESAQSSNEITTLPIKTCGFHSASQASFAPVE